VDWAHRAEGMDLRQDLTKCNESVWFHTHARVFLDWVNTYFLLLKGFALLCQFVCITVNGSYTQPDYGDSQLGNCPGRQHTRGANMLLE